MARNVWAGLLNWWKPTPNASTKANFERAADDDRSKQMQSAPAPEGASTDEGGRGWTLREMNPTAGASAASVSTALSTTKSTTKSTRATKEAPANESFDSEVYSAPQLADGPPTDSYESEPTAEELMEFLAADFEPDEADPEFKRKLRDELWTLVQQNQMTRQ